MIRRHAGTNLVLAATIVGCGSGRNNGSPAPATPTSTPAPQTAGTPIPYSNICARPAGIGSNSNRSTSLPPNISRTLFVSSTTGNDSRSLAQAQSPTTPWKTLAKVSASMAQILPGTAVLLKRGDTFVGTIHITINGTQSAPVVFGSYGDAGREAMVRGSIRLTGWSLHSGHIYVANASAPVKDLFVSGSRQTLARHPNSGYLSVTDIHPNGEKAGLVSDEITGNWTNATVRMKTVNWAFEARTVQAQAGSAIAFDSETSYPIPIGNGFFFDGKLAALDQPGEWFHDATTSKIYFWAPNGVDPDTLFVEGAIHESGFTSDWNRSDITIQDLHIEQFSGDGISLRGGGGAGKRLRVLNTTVQQVGRHGIALSDVEEGLIEGNSVRDALGAGINVAGGATRTGIRRNTLERIGLVPGRGVSGVGAAEGVHLWGGQGSTVEENYVAETGYNGIRVDGNGHTVSRNIVRNVLKTLDDGAGLYTWGTASTRLVFRENFVCTATGNRDGTAHGGDSLAMGIYLDNNASFVTVEKNTVLGVTGSGLLANSGSHDHTIRRNVFYDNALAQVIFADDLGNSVGSTITGNLMYSLAPGVPALNVVSNQPSFDFGSSDSNLLANPFSRFVVKTRTKSGGTTTAKNLVLEGWRAESGNDQNSRTSISIENLCQVTGALGGNLIADGTFSSGTSGWSCWTDRGTCALASENRQGMNGNSLKITYTPSGEPFNLTYAAGFAFEERQWYRLRFRTVSATLGEVLLQAQEHGPSYGILQDIRRIPLRTAAEEHDVVFQMESGFPSSRIDFNSSQAVFWLDDVRLEKVTVDCSANPRDRHLLLANPHPRKMTVALPAGTWHDARSGTSLGSSVVLEPFESKIAVRQP